VTLLTAMTALTGWRLAALEALKKSLLHRAFEGEL
jgi:hypothetical protein